MKSEAVARQEGKWMIVGINDKSSEGFKDIDNEAGSLAFMGFLHSREDLLFNLKIFNPIIKHRYSVLARLLCLHR